MLLDWNRMNPTVRMLPLPRCLVTTAQVHSKDLGRRSRFRTKGLNLEEFAKEVSDLADGNVALKSRKLFLYSVNSNSVRQLSKSPGMFSER